MLVVSDHIMTFGPERAPGTLHRPGEGVEGPADKLLIRMRHGSPLWLDAEGAYDSAPGVFLSVTLPG